MKIKLIAENGIEQWAEDIEGNKHPLKEATMQRLWSKWVVYDGAEREFNSPTSSFIFNPPIETNLIIQPKND